MENNEQQLPVQQNEDLLEFSDAEKIKELFEYEMTEVLLGFKKEAVRFKRKDVSEYLDMDLPQTGIEYASPEIELNGIEYSETEKIAPFSVSVKETPSSEGNVPEIPKVPDVRLDVSVSHISADDLVYTGANVPHTEKPDIHFAGNIDFILPDSLTDTVNADIRVSDIETKISDTKNPPVNIPEIHSFGEIYSSRYNNTGVKDFEHEIPSANINTDHISAGKVSEKEIRTDIPSTEITGIVFAAEDIRLHETALTGIDMPHDTGIKNCFDLPTVSDDRSFPDIDADTADINSDILSAGTAEAPAISISVPLAKPFVFPVFSQIKTAEADYPDIPGKPDFSDYYSGIIESVRSEI